MFFFLFLLIMLWSWKCIIASYYGVAPHKTYANHYRGSLYRHFTLNIMLSFSLLLLLLIYQFSFAFYACLQKRKKIVMFNTLFFIHLRAFFFYSTRSHIASSRERWMCWFYTLLYFFIFHTLFFSLAACFLYSTAQRYTCLFLL